MLTPVAEAKATKAELSQAQEKLRSQQTAVDGLNTEKSTLGANLKALERGAHGQTPFLLDH